MVKIGCLVVGGRRVGAELIDGITHDEHMTVEKSWVHCRYSHSTLTKKKLWNKIFLFPFFLRKTTNCAYFSFNSAHDDRDVATSCRYCCKF